MKFNIKHFFQYNRITKDNEENFKKTKNQTTFFTYLDERHSGVDPGLILGCCQNFTKTMNIEMM